MSLNSLRIDPASRENLDNIVMVVNCNLQRLDGPYGNSKIVQELLQDLPVLDGM